ncbi:non-ribosomal peptide synthetase [Mucilaginibacter sp.]
MNGITNNNDLKSITSFFEKQEISLIAPTTEELSRQLAEWNNTKYDYPAHTALHKLISGRAVECPDKTAITFGEQKITYKILNEQVNQLAAILIKNEVKKGDRVGLALDRSAEMVIALLAIMKTGAVYIPLDPQFPLNRINYMLEDSQAVILLTSIKYKNHFQSPAKELLIEELWETLDNYPATDPEVEVNGNDLVYILYTSGSTGLPKGAQITHQNLVNFLISMQRAPGLTATDKLLAVTTISFDIAGLELYLPLLAGAEIVIADTKATKDGWALLDIIKKEKVSVLQATPYTWRLLLEAGWDASTPLKVICGGEALPLELSQKILERASSLWNVYGPTETTIWSTVKQLTSADEVISIGRPINNTAIYIVDKYLNPLAPGIPGEIYIGGDGVAMGYLNRPELTAEKFVEDPFSKQAGNKMYRTGDLGKFMPNGEIECLGRIDAQVKIRGYRIETGVLEYQLAKENDIKQAVVIARPDKFGVDKLLAFIITKNTDEALNTTARIHNWKAVLKNSLPDYMVPDNFIIVPAMPLTPNGKIDKKALPDPEISDTVKLHTGPRNETEAVLTGIWQELLGLQQVGIYDNFFDLGGHSLLALRVIANVEKVTSKQFPVNVLFEYQTIEKFAEFLEEDGKKSKLQSLVPIKAAGNNKPLYVVSGINGTAFAFVRFANMLDAEQPVYLLQEPQEIGEMEEFPATVEGIAATYIDQILKQNPDGPFAIAGHCFGGIIAFEMAKQMEKMGKEVKLLALMDIDISDFETLQPGMKKNLYFIKHKIQNELHKIYKNTYLFVAHRQLFFKYRNEYHRRLLNKYKKIAKPNYNIEEYNFSQKVTQLYEKAKKNYQFTPYNIDVIIFRAKIASYHRDDKKFSGWKPFVNSIEVRDVEGDHLTMLESNDLPTILQQDLNRYLK